MQRWHDAPATRRRRASCRPSSSDLVHAHWSPLRFFHRTRTQPCGSRRNPETTDRVRLVPVVPVCHFTASHIVLAAPVSMGRPRHPCNGSAQRMMQPSLKGWGSPGLAGYTTPLDLHRVRLAYTYQAQYPSADLQEMSWPQECHSTQRCRQ